MLNPIPSTPFPMKPTRMFLAALCGLSLICIPRLAAESAGTGPTATRIRTTATEFLASLSADQRKLAVFPVDDPERKDWSNLPHTIHPRKGISMGELSPVQRLKAHHLIQAGLSSQGYLKASGIMQLDEVLLHLSGQDKSDKPMFGLRYYWLSFLGEPSAEKPWGWQLDGHHLALNFSLVGNGVALTPQFMGSDPHEVQSGLHAGWRVPRTVRAGRACGCARNPPTRRRSRCTDRPRMHRARYGHDHRGEYRPR